ncbi:hypothetical protein PG997_005362 [Apiospora hydei]|uniref:Clr5 domain-containing protein n=1 Tax=Apiospora hydei TaxID=1337664 RepID=A0ABR1X4S0_9PEZI
MEQAWNKHRSKLERLYVEESKSVREIMDIMKRDHGFIATKHHYNKHFKAQWRCVKKVSATVWTAILPHVQRFEREGKGVVVFIDTKRMSSQEVRNAMARYKRSIANFDPADRPKRLEFASDERWDSAVYITPPARADLFDREQLRWAIRGAQKEALTILKEVATLDLVFSLAGVSHLYETRALARNLFNLAIEVRDVETITYIVKKSHIDLNEAFPIHGSNRKPIEWAVAINDAHVVDTLIKLGASVNGTNALMILLESRRGLHHERLGDNPLSILDLVLSANPDVSEKDMTAVVAKFESDVVSRLILERVDVTYQQWSEDPVLLQVFLHQPYFICYEVLRNLERYSADLNDGEMLKHLSCRFPDEGFLNLLRTFPQLQITDDILLSIVRKSKDMSVIKHLLIDSSGAHVADETWNEVERDSTNDIPKLLVVLENIPSECGRDLRRLKASLITAALEGDVDQINKVVVTAETTYGMSFKELLPYSGKIINECIRKGTPLAALTMVEVGGAHCEFDGRECLESAARIQHPALFKALLDAQFKFNLEDWNEELSMAVKNNNIKFIRALIEVLPATHPPLLHSAIRCKNLHVAELLLGHGANINERCLVHGTPLQAAVESLDPSVVQFVLEHGAEPHDPVALYMAIKNGYVLFDLIMNAHKCRYKKGRKGWGFHILCHYIDTNDLDKFRELVLMHNADVHCFDYSRGPTKIRITDIPKRRSTPFGHAIMMSKHGDLRILEFLLQNRNKTNCFPDTMVLTLGNFGSYPRPSFLTAIDTGHCPTVKLFLQHGATPALPRRIGQSRTPLQQAVETGSMDIIQLLLDHGASVNEPAAYNRGATALQLAAIGGYFPIVMLLLEHGAMVDAPAAKANGVTALEGAAQHGRLDTVALLLSLGAADHGKDKHQINRAIRYAKEEGHAIVQQLLEDFVERGVIQTHPGFYPEFVDFGDT